MDLNLQELFCFEPLFFEASWEGFQLTDVGCEYSTYDHHTSKITWMILRRIYMMYVSLINDKMLYIRSICC